MKKLAISMLGLLTLTIGIYSCSKESTSTTKTTTSNKLKSSSNSFSLTVSSSGFLVFPTENDLFSYLNYINSSTNETINSYHSSIGFISKLGTNANPQTEVQKKDYCFNANGVVQVSGTIFRYDELNNTILSMPSTSFIPLNYNELVSGQFNAQFMNKFNAYFEHDPSFNIFNFCQTTPFGYQDPSGGENGDRMFGQDCKTVRGCQHNAVTNGWDCQDYQWCCSYFFFINTGCDWGPIAPPPGTVFNTTPY